MTARLGLALIVGLSSLALETPARAHDDAAADFWHRDTMTGDWGGLRDVLAAEGVTFTATYTGEVFGNVRGGIKRGAEYDGAFLPQIDFDLDELLDWTGASARISMLQGTGPALSTGWVGNLLNVSGVVTIPPATRLYNAWLQQTLFNKTVSVRAGLMNVDAEFLTSTTASTFMNSSLGWPSWAAVDLPGGGPAYPLSSPGVRVKISPAPEGIYLQGAVFSGDPTGHSGSNSLGTSIPSGTEISFTGGVFAIGEVGYQVNQAKDAKGPPPMAFKLGGWYASSTHFQDQRYATNGVSLASPLSNGMPLNHTGDWGVYGVADAALYRPEGGGGLSGFVRVGGGSPSDRNLVTVYADAGLTYQGLVPTRDNDTLGFAVAYLRIGDSARGLDQDTQTFTASPLYPVRNQEVMLELTYQAQLTPWLTMQPDIQYIINPSGLVLNSNGAIRANAVVLGMRSVVTF